MNNYSKSFYGNLFIQLFSCSFMTTKFGKLLFAPWGCKNKNYGSAQVSENIFRKIFKKIVIFDPQEEINLYGQEKMNRKFVEIVEKEKPDFVFLWLIYEEFFIDTLVKIKKVSPNTKIINFFGDDDTLFENYSRFVAPLFDCSMVFQTDFIEKYKKDGVNSVFKSIGLDLDYYKPIKTEKKYDVSFIGTPKKDRYDFISHLIKNDVNVTIFGAGWEKHPDLKENYAGKLSKERLIEVINQSKINLSFTKNYLGKVHFVGRVTEIAACKSFLLSEYFQGYYDLYRKNEIIMFKDKKDLLEKVKYYLKNEREREEIAARAYKRAVKEQSLEKETVFALKNMKNEKYLEDIEKYKESTGKVFYFTKKDMKLNINEIKNKITEYDYIGFKEQKTKHLPYKEYLQVYSLKKSDKKISCCDYYINSLSLGDYLLFNSKFCYGELDKRDFFALLTPSQLIIEKDYFSKNIEKFIGIFSVNMFDKLKDEDFAFVSLPLLRKMKLNNIGDKIMEKAYIPKYEEKLRMLNNQKKIYTNFYLYKLILNSLFGKIFILKQLKKKYMTTISKKQLQRFKI